MELNVHRGGGGYLDLLGEWHHPVPVEGRDERRLHLVGCVGSSAVLADVLAEEGGLGLHARDNALLLLRKRQQIHQPGDILVADEGCVCVRVREELGLGDELAIVDALRQRLHRLPASHDALRSRRFSTVLPLGSVPQGSGQRRHCDVTGASVGGRCCIGMPCGRGLGCHIPSGSM